VAVGVAVAVKTAMIHLERWTSVGRVLLNGRTAAVPWPPGAKPAAVGSVPSAVSLS